MAQALHIANGDTLNQKLAAKGNRIETLLATGKPDDAITEEAYLIALSRFPTAKEKSSVIRLLADTKTPEEKRAALEDIFWGLMSSREFLFNH
jgi:hypothetical protein